MKRLRQLSLRQLLTLPYVVLVLATAAIIGLLSYRAGSGAVDTLSDLVLNETVDRIAQAVDEHVSGSEAVLETAFPTDVAAPATIATDIERLRERLWLATTIHRDPNNYAYYGDRRGQFIGLWRYSESEAELRLRTDGVSPRSVYRFSRINGLLNDPKLESQIFDPRERPWFKAGQSTLNQTWTAIYIDFKSLELVGTRARRVDGADGEFEGVVATDMSLGHLNNFLKTLSLSENGVAFVVENDGNLIAVSRGPHIRKGAGDDNGRLNAAHATDQLVAETYDAVSALLRSEPGHSETQTVSFEDSNGATIQAGYARLRDDAGLDWIVAVATPRSDFMSKVETNVQRTIALALASCGLIILLGLGVLNRISSDLHQLAHAARRMGEGDAGASVPTDREDEIGDLARTFSELQTQLLTDRLTGIGNREAMLRRLEERIVRHRRSRRERPFALLFVDLDHFKPINDDLGHEVGDQVLIEVSRRLSASVREHDTVARFGGDEFVILLDEVDNRTDARLVADALQANLAMPYAALEQSTDDAAHYSRGASIGIAVCPEDGQDMQTLLRCADETMYSSKRQHHESQHRI